MNSDVSAAKIASDIMLYYNKVFCKRCQVTSGRTRKIRARLRSFTPEQIMRAIENLKRSPFHNGKNPQGREYNSPEFLFRNDEQIERWVNYYKEPDDDRVKSTCEGLKKYYGLLLGKYFDMVPAYDADDESVLKRCSEMMVERGLVGERAAHSVMLSFFMAEYGEDKTLEHLISRFDHIIMVAPYSKKQAPKFIRSVYRKRSINKVVSQEEAISLLLNELGYSFDE